MIAVWESDLKTNLCISLLKLDRVLRLGVNRSIQGWGGSQLVYLGVGWEGVNRFIQGWGGSQQIYSGVSGSQQIHLGVGWGGS